MSDINVTVTSTGGNVTIAGVTGGTPVISSGGTVEVAVRQTGHKATHVIGGSDELLLDAGQIDTSGVEMCAVNNPFTAFLSQLLVSLDDALIAIDEQIGGSDFAGFWTDDVSYPVGNVVVHRGRMWRRIGVLGIGFEPPAANSNANAYWERWYLTSRFDTKAGASHTHPASAIVSGTIATDRLASGTASSTSYLRGDQTWATITPYTLPQATPSTLGGVVVGTGLGMGTGASSSTMSVAFGTTSVTACVGNDSRLSDSRTPTQHASSHASNGSDPITVGTAAGRIVTTTTGGKLAAATTISPAGVEVSPPNVPNGSNPADLIALSVSYDASTVFSVSATGDVTAIGTIAASALSGSLAIGCGTTELFNDDDDVTSGFQSVESAILQNRTNTIGSLIYLWENFR
jgi:hypothetical protein